VTGRLLLFGAIALVVASATALALLSSGGVIPSVIRTAFRFCATRHNGLVVRAWRAISRRSVVIERHRFRCGRERGVVAGRNLDCGRALWARPSAAESVPIYDRARRARCSVRERGVAGGDSQSRGSRRSLIET